MTPEGRISAADPYNLERFVRAQDSTFQQARAELRAGRKQSHWMWFIFPQLRGLGASPTAQRYAISGLEEAVAYLEHPVLGPRLCECTEIVNGLQHSSVAEIFGYPDDLKFHSSVTLFAEAEKNLSPQPTGSVFAEALAKYFGGGPDQQTLTLLRR